MSRPDEITPGRRDSGNRVCAKVTNACGLCLRRGALVGLLGPHVARVLSEHRAIPAVLSLGERELIQAVAGRRRDAIEGALSSFDAERAREEASEAGLAMVCRHDSLFPPSLLDPPDAPAMLYLRGDPADLRRLALDPPVAIVGSRRGSAYGAEVAWALARDLAGGGVPVVSGMALGIDAAAHEGALAGGGLTVAVLAGGADVPYPRSKSGLYRRIAATGLVVSEVPPGRAPFRWSFPARNRIMAALSHMTVVVEGTDSSGSLISARFAADLGREVGAVPGQVTSALAAGPNALIAEGACVVRSATDVLDALYGAGAASHRPLAPEPPKLDPRLRSLLEAVERGDGTVDTLASDPGEVADVLSGLTELELLGLIRRGPGGGYVRCA